jgi:hypothetical protein
MAAKETLKVACPNCGRVVPHRSPYCDACGRSLSGVPPLPPQPEASYAKSSPADDPAIKRFLHEQQDPEVVKQSYDRASEILIEGEEIEYIATGNKSVMGLASACVVATNRRLIIYKKKILGKVMLDDCFWRDVRDAQMRDTYHGISLVIETLQGWKVGVESLPKAQAWRIYEVGANHNARLKAGLDELIVELQAQAESSSPLTEVGAVSEVDIAVDVAAVALPVSPELGHAVYVMPIAENSAEAQASLPVAVPAPLHDAAQSPATGPLPELRPLELPTVAESAPPLQAPALPTLGQDFLHPGVQQERFTQGPQGAVPMSALLSGLDDLFAPSSSKAGSNFEPPLETQPELTRPIPDVQIEPALVAASTGEQGAYLTAQPNLLTTYQIGVEHILGGSSNGSNGNGNHHIAKKKSAPVEELRADGPPRESSRVKSRASTPRDDAKLAEPAASEEAERGPKENFSWSLSAAPLGSMAVGEPPKSPSSVSPMRKLKQLRRMLEAGLITEADYETKKADILSRI